MKLCECGCGEEIFYTSKRRKDDQPRFRQGHHLRVKLNAGTRQTYIPKSEEVPLGICECGCGKPTAICGQTVRARRHFAGYPLPFLHGHSNRKEREQHHSWKGGRVLTDKGYTQLRLPDHPHANSKGYVLEHRLVMAEHIGRWPERSEHVHHKNEIRTDNRIENLELLDAGEHARLHNLEKGIIPPSRKGFRKSA